MSLVDSITGGISRAIHTMFGSGISTYTDTVKQGLTARGFHIRLLDASRTPEINGRERRDHPFDVRYFPETDDMSELYAVSERLYLAL